jgi:small subunit ribosomal protein S1
MVTKMMKNEPPPARDEAWWAALLAEESKQPQPFAKDHQPPPVHTERDKPAERAAIKIPVDWEQAQELYAQDQTLQLAVTGFNRGGLLVGKDGLQGFVPVSHLLQINCQTEEEERNQILGGYVGKQITVKVIECDSERGRVVFSERAALAASGRRNQLFDDIRPGEKACGFVTNITDFGVFIDLGGVEGLIHVSELSWGRVRHPADMVEVGDKLYAIVLQVDKERARIALSLKRLNTNPWETAEQRYKPGQIVEAVVTSIVPFGAFARLEDGLDGLIHISELTVPGQSGGIIQRLAEGQSLQVRVLNVDAARQRLGLSLKLSNGNIEKPAGG